MSGVLQQVFKSAAEAWQATGTSEAGPVEMHLGVRLGRLALGCRHRCSSSDASLSIPQSLQSLPLFMSAMVYTVTTWKTLLQGLSGMHMFAL